MVDKLYPEFENPRVEVELKLQQEFKDKYEVFQQVLGTGPGTKVLAHILEMCHFGVTLNPNNPAEIAEYNLGITILALSGWLKQFCLTLGIKYKEN